MIKSPVASVNPSLPGDFRGSDPIDSYCGMWDTRIKKRADNLSALFSAII